MLMIEKINNNTISTILGLVLCFMFYVEIISRRMIMKNEIMLMKKEISLMQNQMVEFLKVIRDLKCSSYINNLLITKNKKEIQNKLFMQQRKMYNQINLIKKDVKINLHGFQLLKTNTLAEFQLLINSINDMNEDNNLKFATLACKAIEASSLSSSALQVYRYWDESGKQCQMPVPIYFVSTSIDKLKHEELKELRVFGADKKDINCEDGWGFV